MAKKTVTSSQFDAPGAACDFARHKARYAHRDWVVYPLKQGGWMAEAKTARVIKTAMLQAGTAGKWFMFLANTAWPMRMSWGLGVIQLRNSALGI